MFTILKSDVDTLLVLEEFTIIFAEAIGKWTTNRI